MEYVNGCATHTASVSSRHRTKHVHPERWRMQLLFFMFQQINVLGGMMQGDATCRSAHHDGDSDEGRHSLVDIIPVNLRDVDHHERSRQDEGRTGAVYRDAGCE